MLSFYVKIYEKKLLEKTLRVISAASTLFVFAIFSRAVILSAISSIKEALLFCVMLAVPFLLVRVARTIINAPRPYEVYDFEANGLPVPHKRKGGSFPSMHVFSAFAIGTMQCFGSIGFGLAVIAFALMIAVCRVLLGVHFIKDVIAGALLGAISGVTGALMASLFL